MKLSELARRLKAEHTGEASVAGVSSVVSARTGDLVYAADEKHLADALNSQAEAVIAAEFARATLSKKPRIIARNPKLAFARAAKILQSEAQKPAGIDPTAIVAPEAQLGKGVF